MAEYYTSCSTNPLGMGPFYAGKAARIAFGDSLPSDIKEGPPSVQYGKVGDAVDAFVKYLAENKEATVWRVVFSCGTVVEALQDAAEFAGFKAKNFEYPRYRIVTDLVGILVRNRLAWEKFADMKGPVAAAVRRGYAALIKDGYPWPGMQDADRTVEARSDHWITKWPHRSPNIYNLLDRAEGETFSSHAVSVTMADLRRYDYMEPRVYAVISPDLKLTTVFEK